MTEGAFYLIRRTPLISVSLRISAGRPNQTIITPSELVNIYISIYSGKKIYNIFVSKSGNISATASKLKSL